MPGWPTFWPPLPAAVRRTEPVLKPGSALRPPASPYVRLKIPEAFQASVSVLPFVTVISAGVVSMRMYGIRGSVLALNVPTALMPAYLATIDPPKAVHTVLLPSKNVAVAPDSVHVGVVRPCPPLV